MAISLIGNVQIRDGRGELLFPEALVRRAYRVGPTDVLKSDNPDRGYRLYVYAIGLSLVRLRTEGFGTFGQPPDTHAYVEGGSDVVIHFERHGETVRIASHVPNVPDEEMPVITLTLDELHGAIDRFVDDIWTATQENAPEAFDWVALHPLRAFREGAI